MNPDNPLLRQIYQELAASQAHQLLFISCKWAALGGLLGLLLGVAGILVFRKIGWYRSSWRREAWVRWPLWVFSTGLCAFLAGGAGFFHGIIRGSEHVLHHSQLGTRIFPQVGDALADGIVAVQAWLAETNTAGHPATVNSERIEAFRKGTWEINAPEFVRGLGQIESGVVSNLVADVEEKLVAGNPDLKEGLPNTVLHHTLRVLGGVLMQEKLNPQLKRLHLEDFRKRLVAEALRQGNPDTLSRSELSGFLVREAIVPGLMKPIRFFAEDQVKLFAILAVLSVVLPAFCFRLTFGRNKAAPEGVQDGA